jgi:hypothetical protein
MKKVVPYPNAFLIYSSTISQGVVSYPSKSPGFSKSPRAAITPSHFVSSIIKSASSNDLTKINQTIDYCRRYIL